MDKFCNKCKKVFGAAEPRATIHGKDYCKNCCKCDKCQQTLGAGQNYEKDGKWYCQKCHDDLNDSGKNCSFCKKKLTTEYLSSPDKPGIISCKECEKELHKPKGYNPNAKIYCQCGKTTEPAWRWNGNIWELHFKVNNSKCCQEQQQEEYDQCRCGEKKTKKELFCKNCIERERERQNWKVFRVLEPLKQSPALLF